MEKWSKQKGFTIVELLIVIVVIGILAAITIVAYNGIQNRARDTSVRSDLANLAKQFELYNVDNGRYPIGAGDLDPLTVSINKSAYAIDSNYSFNLVPCTDGVGRQYAITAVPTGSFKRFYVTNGSGVQEYTGANSWTGAVNYTTMCNDALAGSGVISGGSGWGGAWRAWTNS